MEPISSWQGGASDRVDGIIHGESVVGPGGGESVPNQGLDPNLLSRGSA